MKLIILGNNGPFPEPAGACSGYLLQAGKALLQFDFGTGVLARLTGRMPPEGLDALFLSHWHNDHASDLLPLIYRLEACGKQLHVYAPVDTASPIRAMVQKASCFILHDLQPGDTVEVKDVCITVGSARHPVPGIMFRVACENRTLVYTGDTNTLPELADFFRDADLLLADGLFTDELWAENKPHLSARLAARLSVEAHTGKLVITHLNPFIDPALILAQAREERKDVLLARPDLTIEL